MVVIKLDRKDHKITVKKDSKKDLIILRNKNKTIEINHVGREGKGGDKGDKGDVGIGIPAGGVENQVLQKSSAEDYDFKWLTPTFEDKYYTTTFSVSSIVTVHHNLMKYPAVTVLDSAGDEVRGTVTHDDTQTLTLTFSAPFSGRVTCN